MWNNFYLLFVSCFTISVSSTLQHQDTVVEAHEENGSTVNQENYEEHFEQEEIFRTFGSLHTLEKLSYWADKEERIYQIFKNKMPLILKEMELIEKYTKDYESSSVKALKNSKKPLKTPEDRGNLIGSSAILSHIMTNRYVTIVSDLRDLLKSDMYRKTEDQMNAILELGEQTESGKWPNYEDLYMSHLSFMNIQEVFGQTAKQLYQGVRTDTNFGGELNAFHCADLGLFALSHEHFSAAVEWLELSLKLWQGSPAEQSIPKHFVQTLLDLAIREHNDVHWDNPFSLETFKNPVYFGQSERVTNQYIDLQKDGGRFGNGSNPFTNMLELCRGANFQPEEIRSRMKCFYKTKGHPYLVLSPLKVEQLSDYPYIIQLHDILGEEIINQYYQLRGELKVSTTVNKNSTFKEGLMARSSAGGVPHLAFLELMDRKSDLIMKMPHGEHPGLEYLQTVEYVYGRRYIPHKDPILPPEDDPEYPAYAEERLLGERLATILYYIQEPASGGATPFCEVGIAVTPKKGSAVYWLNLYKNGTIRSDIIHASCPVLHGNKIVLNQWILYNPHFNTHKCSLNQFE